MTWVVLLRVKYRFKKAVYPIMYVMAEDAEQAAQLAFGLSGIGKRGYVVSVHPHGEDDLGLVFGTHSRFPPRTRRHRRLRH